MYRKTLSLKELRLSKVQSLLAGFLIRPSRFLYSFTTLERMRELPDCVAHLIMGSLMGTRCSATGQFFPLPLVTVPEFFAELNSTQFLLLSNARNDDLVMGFLRSTD